MRIIIQIILTPVILKYQDGFPRFEESFDFSLGFAPFHRLWFVCSLCNTKPLKGNDVQGNFLMQHMWANCHIKYGESEKWKKKTFPNVCGQYCDLYKKYGKCVFLLNVKTNGCTTFNQSEKLNSSFNCEYTYCLAANLGKISEFQIISKCCLCVNAFNFC